MLQDQPLSADDNKLFKSDFSIDFKTKWEGWDGEQKKNEGDERENEIVDGTLSTGPSLVGQKGCFLQMCKFICVNEIGFEKPS